MIYMMIKTMIGSFLVVYATFMVAFALFFFLMRSHHDEHYQVR